MRGKYGKNNKKYIEIVLQKFVVLEIIEKYQLLVIIGYAIKLVILVIIFIDRQV